MSKSKCKDGADKYVRWWMNTEVDGDQDWTPYPDSLQETFDANYASNSELLFDRDDVTFSINFKKMVETNTETGESRQVQHTPCDYLDNSAYVLRSAERRGKLMPLLSTSESYKQAMQEFRKTMKPSYFAVHNIFQVVNSNEDRVNFEKKRDELSGEQLLFHGVPCLKTADGIIRHNFDPSLHGSRNGHCYGKGTYFATVARLSHRYTGNKVNGRHYMFLARVVVGEFTNGLSRHKRPPKGYNSCVDWKKSPRVFVIFDETQCLPGYLIEYEDGISQTALQRNLPTQASTSTPAATVPVASTSTAPSGGSGGSRKRVASSSVSSSASAAKRPNKN